MPNYTPNTWNSGDIVTKTKLDRLEAGVAAASSALVHTVGNSGSTLTLDAASASGHIKTITLSADCTFTLTGATAGTAATLDLFLTQDSSGGRFVTWPASVKWPGSAPILSTGANMVDRVVLTSYDGGTTWYGDVIGQAYVQTFVPPAQPSWLLGVASNADPATQLPRASGIGCTIMRIEFDYNAAVSTLKPIFDQAATLGIRVQPIAGWDNGANPVPDLSNLVTWAAAFGTGGTNWPGGVTAFPMLAIELGNENSFSYKSGSWDSPELAAIAQSYGQKARALQVALASSPSAAARAVGTIIELDDGNSGSANWINNVKLGGGQPLFDTMVAPAAHPYGPDYMTRINRIAGFLATAGSTKKYYLTEYGLATDNGASITPDNYGWPVNQTYTQAGTAIGGVISTMRASGKVAQLMIYEMSDLSAPGANTFKENYFGIVQQNGTAKGAYTSTLASLMVTSAGVDVDSVSPGPSGASSAGSTTTSWGHTCTGTNRLLIVGVAVGGNPSTGITTSVTYNGLAMTSIGSVASNNDTVGYVQLFRLVAPTVGTHSVVVTTSLTTSATSAGSVSFVGVNQSTPVGTPVTAFGDSTTPSVTVTGTTAGNLVIDASCCGKAFSADTQTSQWRCNTNTASAAGNAACSIAPGGGSVTLAHTVTADFWGSIAVEVRKA
jgi:hypothetical protein